MTTIDLQVFVDEIENGIHHTVFPELWTFIAAASRTTGTQCFATTHSAECLSAAYLGCSCP